MTAQNHDETSASDFEKRLLEMEIRATNWVNSQLSSLNDAQKIEYDRRLSIAYSLIEPYQLTKKELASARAVSKSVADGFGYLFLGFILLIFLGSYIPKIIFYILSFCSFRKFLHPIFMTIIILIYMFHFKNIMIKIR